MGVGGRGYSLNIAKKSRFTRSDELDPRFYPSILQYKLVSVFLCVRLFISFTTPL